MQPFTILTPVHGASKQEIEIAVLAFARLLKSVTKRQRLALRLAIVDDGSQSEALADILSHQNFDDVQVVSLQELAPQGEMSLCFLPGLRQKTDWSTKALSCGLPVLTYEGTNQERYLDNSCGLFISGETEEESVFAFSDILKMLVFDPAALRMMMESAKRKFKTILPMRDEKYYAQVA